MLAFTSLVWVVVVIVGLAALLAWLGAPMGAAWAIGALAGGIVAIVQRLVSSGY